MVRISGPVLSLGPRHFFATPVLQMLAKGDIARRGVRLGRMNWAVSALVGVACSIGMSCGAPNDHLSRTERALVVLERAEPAHVMWKHLRSFDVNCDGMKDEVFTAVGHARFYVGVVVGSGTVKARQSVVSFELSGDSQSSFCGKFESLTPEPLTPEIAETAGEVPDGYRAGKGCEGLKLVTGECDSFHLFWNHVDNRLDWWRL